MRYVICNEAVPLRPHYAGVATRTRNVSEYMLVLALCLVIIIYDRGCVYTDENERVLDVVVALVDALSLLAVVEALLRDVDEILDLGQCPLQTALGLGQRLDL